MNKGFMKIEEAVKILDDIDVADADNKAKVYDNVRKPKHYASGGIECIDAIRAALTEEEFRGYCKGNVIKYAWRSGKKGPAEEDLAKARSYIEFLIGKG